MILIENLMILGAILMFVPSRKVSTIGEVTFFISISAVIFLLFLWSL